MSNTHVQYNIATKGFTALKVMSFHVMSAISLTAHILVFLLSLKGSLFPSADALMNILSSFAEIIAGLYGITMASYTFFLSRIDSLTASDSSLELIVDCIKRRFKYLMWFVTFNVVLTLFTTLVLMYAPIPDKGNASFFYRLFCNEFVLSVASSILLILYYSILVINPNSIQKEALRLKKRLSDYKGAAGSLNEFILHYSRMIEICTGMISKNVLQQIYENNGKQFSNVIELLKETRPDLRPLLQEVARVHRYYECTINCKTLSVTQDMCSLVENLVSQLEYVTVSLEPGESTNMQS